MNIQTPRECVTRRRFLIQLSVGLSAFSAALIAVPVLGSLLEPFLRRSNAAWRSVGLVDSFAVGKTVAVSFRNAAPLPWAGVTANSTAWLRRKGEAEFIAFAINCTHLGCPVRWLPEAELFMCPCHGGIYTAEGKVAAGPPPRSLTRHKVRIRNGEVELLTMPIPIT